MMGTSYNHSADIQQLTRTIFEYEALAREYHKEYRFLCPSGK
jgi:hypothetical protein